MRILAIDYGEARIGLAACEEIHFPYPVETVAAQPWAQSAERIVAVARSQRAEKLVFGLPCREDGTEGTAAAMVREYAKRVASLLPTDFPIAWQDEYRSTSEAQARLREAGKNARRQKTMIDQMAAVVILEDYLRSQGLEAAVDLWEEE
jgi:putative Holliday junction resolvase